tara:strand:+ start:1980 stop:2099 length:120 start_codon:yes stop_codon:yes gene_type:complete
VSPDLEKLPEMVHWIDAKTIDAIVSCRKVGVIIQTAPAN